MMTATPGQAARIWLKVGLIGFGGPAGQIALMHRIAVDEQRWIGERDFLAALNFCMLLPGPEAQQLAIYLGWRVHGTAGGLIAGTLFVLPGAVIMLGLSVVYVAAQNLAAVDGLLFGLKAAVLAVVVEAIFRIGRRAIESRLALAVAVASFVGIFFLAAPFPLIIAAAAVVGALVAPKAAAVMAARDGGDQPSRPPPRLSGWRRIAVIAAVGLPLWLGPVAMCMILFGTASSFVAISAFLAKMAVVTFGGAYAVLSYVAQAAVETHGWLGPEEMLAGLGLAETTPGPLILVVQFVAFVAGFRDPAPFAPLGGGVVASLIASWVTFVPSFLWIFAGAPFVERLVALPRLGGALAMVTAAVVGVIANLALWFAIHVLFTEIAQHRFGVLRVLVPAAGSIDPAALLLCAGALIAMLRFRVGMLTTLAACAGLGLAVRLAP